MATKRKPTLVPTAEKAIENLIVNADVAFAVENATVPTFTREIHRAEELIDTVNITLKMYVVIGIELKGLRTEVENTGGGDVYVSTSPVKFKRDEILLAGEKLSFSGTVYLSSTCSPTVKITHYK